MSEPTPSATLRSTRQSGVCIVFCSGILLPTSANPRWTSLPEQSSTSSLHPLSHPGAEAVDALCSPWPSGLLLDAFPPLPLIAKVVRKLLEEKAELLLLTPPWPRRPCFADLVSLSVAPPWRIPNDLGIPLLQGSLVHPDPQSFQLTAWRLSSSS